MTEAIIKNIEITGISTIVGDIVEQLEDLEYLYEDKTKLERLKDEIGLKQVCKVDNNTTSLDLCLAASNKLIEEMKINTSDIDTLIFVTQTPDHFLPSNSAVAHNRLKLESNCACFDINQGCSGYVYGLWVAFSIMNSGMAKKTLLLSGDTMSRAVNKKDKSCRPLFGDSGTATLIEKRKQYTESYFCLNTDGSGNDAIIIPGGGFRNPIRSSGQSERFDVTGKKELINNLNMNGSKVFNFAIQRVPESFSRIMELSGYEKNDIDYYLFHQANKFVIEKIINKIGIDESKVPRETVGRYGNQGPASIPSTISDALHNQLQNNKKRILLSGFGTGFSWASAILDLGNIYCPKSMSYRDG